MSPDSTQFAVRTSENRIRSTPARSKRRIASDGVPLSVLRPRRGYSVVELISAMVLIGIVISISLSVLFSSARQKRIVEQRQFALQYAANLMERITLKGWKNLPVEEPVELPTIPEHLAKLLPELRRTVSVQLDKDDFNCKRVLLEMSWNLESGAKIAPLKLTGWVYPPKENQQ